MIERVDRPDDPRISDYTHIGEPAWLRQHGLFVAESRQVVSRLIASGAYRIRSILLTPPALAAMGEILAAAPTYVADQAVLNDVTGFTFHRGCLAIVERPAPGALSLAGMACLLVMERIGNPDNVGGLFRTGAAFGVDAILLSPGCADPFYRKAIRTSMGAVLSLPSEVVEPWPGGLERLKDEGFRVVALTPRAEAIPLNTVRLEAERVALLVGAEGPGLSDDALAAADLLVRIPMASGVDSLNVTVAAGVALSHVVARRT